MGKHNKSLQAHHLYLGAGGLLAVAALVVALTFGLSNAQDPGMMGPPPGGNFTPPPGGNFTPPPGGNFTPPPGDSFTPPPGGSFTPPPGDNFMPPPGMPGQPGQYQPGMPGQPGQYQPGMPGQPGQYQPGMPGQPGQYPQGGSGSEEQMRAGCVAANGTWLGMTATPPCKMPGQTGVPGQMNGPYQPGQMPGGMPGQPGTPDQMKNGQFPPMNQPGGMQGGQQFNPGINQPPMYQPPRYGIFGPSPMMDQGQNGQNGQNGPQNEERMKQQQADQDAQFKKMQEQQVAQIKKELGRMKKEIDRVRTQLDKVTVTDNTPEEIVTAKSALTEIDASMAAVDTCSGDECFDIMPSVGPLMQDIMNPDVMNALQRLKDGPKFAKQLVKEINRTVKKTTSVANTLVKKAKKIKDADIRDAVTADITAAQEQCSTLAKDTIDVANGGDIETASDTVQNELNDACSAIDDLTWKVEGFLNKQQVVKSMDNKVKALTKQLVNFQKAAQKGKFNGDLDAVSQLAVAIPEISAKLVEIKAEKDIDALGDLLDEAASLISDADGFVQDAMVQNMANQFDMFNTAPAPTQPMQGVPGGNG